MARTHCRSRSLSVSQCVTSVLLCLGGSSQTPCLLRFYGGGQSLELNTTCFVYSTHHFILHLGRAGVPRNICPPACLWHRRQNACNKLKSHRKEELRTGRQIHIFPTTMPTCKRGARKFRSPTSRLEQGGPPRSSSTIGYSLAASLPHRATPPRPPSGAFNAHLVPASSRRNAPTVNIGVMYSPFFSTLFTSIFGDSSLFIPK